MLSYIQLNSQQEAGSYVFNEYMSKIMFLHKSHWKQEYFNGFSNKDYSVLMYHAGINLGLIFRVLIEKYGYTLDELKVKYNYSTLVKAFWKCDINLDKLITSTSHLEVDYSYYVPIEILLPLLERNNLTTWSILSNPYTLSDDYIPFDPFS